MPPVATQVIASRFGTYYPGTEIDLEAVPEPVLDAWRAAHLVEDAPDAVPVDRSEMDPERAGRPAADPVETATSRRGVETATSRRMTSGETRHRRFQERAEE